MKKILLLSMISVLLFSACNTGEKQEKTKLKEGSIVVGSLVKGNAEEANFSITLQQAAKLMNDDNRLAQRTLFDYNYDKAWIEIIKISNNSYKYFLAVNADLSSKNNNMTYSCYTVFTELTSFDNNLYYHPEAVQHDLRGKCCGNCQLIYRNGKFDTECGENSNEDNCNGNGRCSLSTSEELTKEQIINDII